MSVSSDIIELLQAGRVVVLIPIGPLATGEPGCVAVAYDAEKLPDSSMAERISAAVGGDDTCFSPSPFQRVDYLGVCEAVRDQLAKIDLPY